MATIPEDHFQNSYGSNTTNTSSFVDPRVEAEVSEELGAALIIDDSEDLSSVPAQNKVPTLQAVFMIFRSIVGIGVLTMPHAVQHFGVYGALIFFPIFGVAVLYVLDLVLRMAEDVGYNGNSIERLIELTENKKYLRTFSIINNWMMISAGIANCIFAVNFLGWAACDFNWGICGDKVWLHVIALAFSLPFCLIQKMNFFAVTSMIATIIIAITSIFMI